ncbi:MAG: ATP phosphoribosyltransferase regulatory subunit, partial [Paenibacillus sp.]|nr:ATP phosphoribosyltransferase regulatory subunit [Paenibacillus sp.]
TAFEYKAEGIGAIDTVGGGGRYNGLVSDIGGPDQPGIGFALGLERIVLLLESQKVDLNAQAPIDLYLIGLGEAAEDMVAKLLYQLRKEGIVAEKDYQGRKMKAMMKSADRMQARFAAILGDDELEKGEVALKELATGEQRLVPITELAQAIRQA